MKKLFLSFLLTFIAGGIYALAFPSFLGAGWLPLTFIALPLFLWKLEEATFKSSLFLILGFNLGLDVVGYYWIPHTLREFGQLPYAVSVLLGAAFCLILQPHWWVYAFWKKFRPLGNWNSEKRIIITALVMTLLERYVQQQFPSYVGSPWLHLAPYLSLAPYFGVSIFSFMTYWLSLEVVAQLKTKHMRPQMWVGMGLFILLNASFPLKNPQSGLNLPVRIVQANIGNFQKVSSERGDANSYETISETYENLSKEDNGFKPHLTIWPETAYPDTFYGTESQLNEIFANIIQANDSELLIGGYDQDLTKSSNDYIESVFNASLLISGDKVKSIYHKNILIPFGETLPFGPLNRTIVNMVPAISLFARGQGIPVMETRAGFRFVTPICYEILESNYMRDLLNQWGSNHFIVNHTNDSWYGNTAEPHQHLFLSKWRALEFQLPIIRSTNTGISSIIYPDGSESRRLGVSEVGRLDVTLPLGKPTSTVYQAYGIFPLLLLVGLIYLITWFRERRIY
ncbi:MAG: apolipoprotein N-acyltransferase [Bdellovibrionales bacterium]|nr:apolipoprotein N-acyltransferase [Bdellovibrionales bacterium]